MKKFFFIVGLIIFSLISCRDEKSEKKTDIVNRDSVKKTSIQWLDSNKNFGKIPEGEILEISYRYKNTGNYPLVMFDVKAGCGCTIVDKPEDPTPPGKEGLIKARFDSKGRAGIVHKYVTVNCNTETGTYTLTFDGEVEARENNVINNNNNNNFPQQTKSL
jgi:hypothetical protein